MPESGFTQLLIALAVTVSVVALFTRLRLAPVIGYLIVGLLLGPSGFGMLTGDHSLDFLAELGIVFMLFALGLEFSLPQMVAMRRLVFGLGSAQMVICSFVFMVAGHSFGLSWMMAFVTGTALAMSSTAVLIKLLLEQGNLHSRKGQIAVSTLLFQDIIAIPLLILIPTLAGQGGEWQLTGFAIALLKGIAVVAALLAAGKWLLPPLFDQIAASKSEETFVLFTLLVALLAGAFTHLMGLSMALGAFLTGMMLSESQYRHQVEAEIRPFRDILLGLFFITVGALLNLQLALESWWLVLFILVLLMLFKSLLIFALARAMGERPVNAVAGGLLLCQAGEFGFVLMALANQHQLVDSLTTTVILSAGIASMMLTPVLVRHVNALSRLLAGKADEPEQPTDVVSESSHDLADHVILCGFGRVGQTIGRFLKQSGVPYLAFDLDPMRVQEARAGGERIYFGDARKPTLLRAAGIERAKMLVITFDSFRTSVQMLHQIRKLRDEMPVLVRTRDDAHLADLQNAGATEVVPETLEAGLMLVAHTLTLLGTPVREIVLELQKVRRNRYRLMHGFFHGESSDVSQQSELDRIRLHPVSLADTGSAIGKTLSEVDWPGLKVEVAAIRRGEEEILDPREDFLLQSHDIVVLSGDPDAIEEAENQLLSGKHLHSVHSH